MERVCGLHFGRVCGFRGGYQDVPWAAVNSFLLKCCRWMTKIRQPEGPDDMVLCNDGDDDDRDSDAAIDSGDGDGDGDGARRNATSLIKSPARAT